MAGLMLDWLAASNPQPQKNLTWPEDLSKKQQHAADVLKTWPAPGRKLEFWRYSDASRLKKDPLKPQTSPVDAAHTADHQVVVAVSDEGVSVPDNLPDWLTVEPIQASEQPRWSPLDQTPELVVQAANQALFSQGVAIKVSAQAPAEARILLRYAVKEPSRWTYVRNLVQLAAGAEVVVDELLVSGRINVNNFYQIGEKAHLKRHQQVILDDQQQHISLQHFTLAGEARVTTQHRHQGGDLQHHVHWVDFSGEQAEYQSGSINKAAGQSHISDIVVVNHARKNNRSEVTHRSLADDSASVFNNAKAIVAKGADGSEIEQDLKNILLSNDAKIASKPELEVYADEVVAAHGSTIGTLDEEAVFYLQSRGIPLDLAREMMMVSFEQEALVC